MNRVWEWLKRYWAIIPFLLLMSPFLMQRMYLEPEPLGRMGGYAMGQAIGVYVFTILVLSTIWRYLKKYIKWYRSQKEVG